MVQPLPADIKDLKKKRAVLKTLLTNCTEKIAEYQDKKRLIEHELATLGDSVK